MTTPPAPLSKLALLVADLEEDDALELVHKRIQSGDDPMAILSECDQGMREVGRRYEVGDYFIAGLIMSGEIFREVVEIIQPLIREQHKQLPSGKILLGTVHGDIHDLGKNIFGMLLTSHGFEVIDLGVDVEPEIFAKKAIEVQPDLVGLSGLITASYESMKRTTATIRAETEKQGLFIPILIGGGFITQEVCKYVGADYWMNDAMAGVRLCEELINS